MAVNTGSPATQVLQYHWPGPGSPENGQGRLSLEYLHSSGYILYQYPHQSSQERTWAPQKQRLLILFADFLPQMYPTLGKERKSLHFSHEFHYRILGKSNYKKKACHFERGFHFGLLWFFLFCLSKMRNDVSKGILLAEISVFFSWPTLLAAILGTKGRLSQQLTKYPLTEIPTSELSFD